MNTIPNRQVICETLLEKAQQDRSIMVLASDSRGSAAMGPFAKAFPEQFVEVGIAEQNIVGISAGLAHSGKKPFVTSPACFLSMRSIEQIKVDVAYSATNVKLVGISGGVSYGALGMSHHSVQDVAVMRAIPGIAVMMPADRHETKRMTEALVQHEGGVYVRIGRNAVQDVYDSDDYEFIIGKSVQMREGSDVTIIAAGETVRVALDAHEALKEAGVSCRVINMHTIKPLDADAIIQAAKETGHIITVEEHSVHGGLGAAVSEVVVQHQPVPMRIIGIPDEPAIAGKTAEVFDHYGISSSNLKRVALGMLGRQE
ncbi:MULTISPECIES: transketolase family protein [Paenibacillus]|uniref:Transketolase C-terminal domain-containing protein n=1 Tax=Paenibacillus violae TaxID=3077234 RepID=A0ABU3REG6_9BACL|nr:MULTISPECIES: transketolase C-terminal domain-containing protein [Paenibacillus]MDU0202471.1 transketolase C-terminal domain-containing protein [Paenibacillus sp. PFR10]MEC0268301.1 transketolase C-terminal domain-containing protein [Paenibacillus anseongense]